MSEEIAPFLLFLAEAGEVKCALWQLQQGDRALALFLSAESASAYRDAAGLEGWQTFQPDRETLVALLDAHVEGGIRLGVLDPDLRQGRRLFDLQAIVTAARSPEANDLEGESRVR